MDVIYFRSKTFNVGGGGGEWVRVPELGKFSRIFSRLFVCLFEDVFPRRHREGFFVVLGSICFFVDFRHF